ncbi:hypothetical protein SCLCIDRAFT_30746 [Scleroderma citrinum Foug A]|uniref:Uncharacterized protein n=1 Tax=Scleroderma citrinum Foug A TaxID=1036808 RepID=A0A0C2YZE4_9AGAM|nr:hypothetical protein SCLCIDRAFT_30746 [Scleroderma citrinum Foug A]
MPSTARRKHVPDSESATSTAENHIRIYPDELWSSLGVGPQEEGASLVDEPPTKIDSTLLIDYGEMDEVQVEPESWKRSWLKNLGRAYEILSRFDPLNINFSS